MNARAFLGNDQVGHEFLFNPDSVSWGYEEAAPPQETLGGRVVQLCSVRVTDMTLTASAGSRKELQKVADDVQQIMEWTIDNQRPVSLIVPSRKWSFRVYVRTLPRVGWSVTTVAYPYQLTLAVDEDLGIATQEILRGQLDRLAAGIGYSPLYHGGSPSDFLNIASELAATGASPYQLTGSSGTNVNIGALGTGSDPGPSDPTGGYRTKFAKDLLTYMNCPMSDPNVNSLVRWMNREGTLAKWNPLATTENEPGATIFNSIGVKNYPSEAIGIRATAATLTNGRYPNIVAALKIGRGLCGDQLASDFSTWSGGGYTSIC